MNEQSLLIARSPASDRDQPDTQPDARTRQLARIALLLRIGMLGTVAGLVLWLLRDVVLVVFAAALFAVLLHGLSRLLTRFTRLPHSLSLGVVVLILVGLIVGLGWYAGPHLADEAGQLKQQLQAQAGDLRGRLGGTGWGRFVLQHLPAGLGGEDGGAGSSLPSGIAGSVAGFLESAFGAVGTMAVILIAGLYFAMSPGLYIDGALRLLPPINRDGGRRIANATGDALWHWIAGQALDMVFVGVLSGIGLALLGVKLSLILGVLAGLSNFVPYIGAIVGFIPAVLIALSQDPKLALYVILLYFAIQGFEGNVLAPIIQRRAAHLAPALTILSQTTVGALFGLPGLMLATPLAAAAVAIVQVLEPPADEKQDKITAQPPARY